MWKLKSMVTTRIVKGMSSFSTVSSINTSIKAAVNDGQPHKALFLFRQMKLSGLEPNHLTFPFIAKACAKISNLKQSYIIHPHILKSPHCSDIYVQTALVDMYVKCGKVEYAYQVFEGMPDRDVTAWNAMLMGFVQVGFVVRVLGLFYRMLFGGFRPDSVTVMGLTQLASGLKDGRLLSSVHCLGIRLGLGEDVLVANTWISAYAKCGDLPLSDMVFNGIDSQSLTVVSWNSIIAGCAGAGEGFKSMGLYTKMLNAGFRPDSSTILNLLGSFVKPDALFQGKLIHCHGVKLGCFSDVSVLNTLVYMYSKCEDVTSARRVFDAMMHKTRISWTVMIGSYAEKGNLEEAISSFNSMEAAGEKPDIVAIIYLISACGQIGALETGRWIDNYSMSAGLKSDVMICNALLDMYVKCGSLRDAEELFLTMEERTIVSWTTMISGYALNGEPKKALDCFDLLLHSGLKPNSITFIAVLQACVHGGLLEKGWEFLDMMIDQFKIKASLDHHACMADLLGRRGKLKEALEYIESMPCKPDAGIWGALLNACKIHRNSVIGQYAADRLFDLEPQAAAPYVEMANIYASAGKWDSVALIRVKMKGNQVRKYPGESIIQVEGKSHTFRVDDRFHPEIALIDEVLSCLELQFKGEVDSSNHTDSCYEHGVSIVGLGS
ncbi:OLC1v1008879C1 [Oldenlandia corymbosa var. corymbosa]|uniref:OLC1v1008879C1 n=1 Tax=Oldenlandia corymbosa var. corymbosa TaxID=529605 RepID=A0AAV1DMQ6_OLDCO|nr:OLC1v1008879C1 [Oldenlandia corymbosa var. corymbosa]